MEIWGVFLFFGLSCSVSSSVSRGDYGEIKIFQSPATYHVESMVLLNDASRKDKEVGYKIIANLDVQAVWGNDTDFLLKFGLNSPKLHSKGKLVTADYLPIKSFWDTHYKTVFYAHWRNGLIEKAYLNPKDDSDLLNYQKSLISLFQFQVIDGDHNETDISGLCDVFYDSVSMQVIRKTKRRCHSPGTKDKVFSEEMLSTRQLIRYTLNEKLDMLDEIHGEEVHTVGHESMGAGVKARAWMRLRREGLSVPRELAHASLEAALAQLPPTLRPMPLPMLLPDEPFEDTLGLAEALREAVGAGEGEEAGGGGVAAEAAAALRAVRALRRPGVRAGDVAAALAAAPDQRSLAALSRLLGAAGSQAVHEAASRELLLAAPDAPPPALHYLNALALAHEPHESVVADVARLGVEARAGAVREAALLAAAAAARRLAPSAPAAGDRLRDLLTRHLPRCTDEECRALYVRALGNLGRADTVEVVLEQAERGGGAALAALQALATLPVETLGPARLRRLAAIGTSAAPLEVRAAALDLLLVRAAPLPPPLLLSRVARVLRASGPNELRRLFWQRAAQLAHEHRPLADVLRMLAPDLRGWDALAQSGTSSVLVRGVGSVGGLGGAALESLQLARGGMLRRGRVALAAPAATTHPCCRYIELWTRGLEALVGGGGDVEEGGEEGEGEEAAGGLGVGAGGAQLPGAELFTGQAQLLGHVWAGRGSEPTPALRALLPLRAQEARLPLLGAGPLTLSAAHAVSLALDAHAQVSLWSRTARAGLELRMGVAGEVRAALEGAAGALRAAVAVGAEPRLRVAVDVDAYEGVALCVRAHTADHALLANASLTSALGARPHRVRRARALRTPLPGRTLELGAPNSAACRHLAA